MEYKQDLRSHIPEDHHHFLKANYRYMTNKELGAALGVTHSAINGRLCRAGLKRSPDDPAVQKMLLEMGESIRIAKQKNGDTYKKRDADAWRPTIKDRIEMKYTEREIRLMYAKLLTGGTRDYPVERIPKEVEMKAFQLPYPEVIEPLSREWKRFA